MSAETRWQSVGWCFFLLHVLQTQPILSQPVLFDHPLSPRIANYDIDVQLTPATRMLRGTETLTWHNQSNDAVTELQFHLYLNAFRNNRSTFMKEAGRNLRETDRDRWGFIDVTRIALPNGEDLTDRMEFIHPDNDDYDDKTVFRLPLDQPLAPDSKIILGIDFAAKLPEPPFARTGAKEEFFFVAQWFPKIGVYIDGRWNCHQFHARSEFFADFGVYNVRMTVPEENIVGATGVEVEVMDNGDGTATHFYHAEDVHDFAWTTSPDYRVYTDRAQDVDLRLLIQPDHEEQWARHLDAAKAAVTYFQNRYGDYPYPNLTVVDPRRGAGATSGMEYPTLFTTGTAHRLPEGIRLVELVTIHEFGHNYWYHLVASNEFEESWMDEGINTYTEIQFMKDKFGPNGDLIDYFGIKLNDLQYQRGQYLFSADYDPTVRRAWEYYSGSSYGTNSYAKPGLILTTLQNYLGTATMQQVLRAYIERWRFKHPKTQDFIQVANAVSGQDLNWFFEQALFSNAVLDYSVDLVNSREIRPGEGFDFNKIEVAADSLLTNGLADSLASAHGNEMDSSETAGMPKIYLSEVHLRRLGQFKFPVELVATFENGERVHETWDGQETWKKYSYHKPTKLVSAEIDPDRKIPLDVNYTNNSMMVDASNLGVNKLATRALFWTQFLLDQPEFVNLITGFIPSL